MPGELAALSTFGAKLVSVFGDPDRPGRTRHQGVVVAYDGMTGAVSCIADAEPMTKIRTACATAAATDALARTDAEVLAIFGTGLQAESHLHALPLVRPFREILLWGQSTEKAREVAERMSEGDWSDDHSCRRQSGSCREGRRNLHGDLFCRAGPAWRMGQAGHAHQPRRIELSRASRSRHRTCGESSLHRRLPSGRARPGCRAGGRA